MNDAISRKNSLNSAKTFVWASLNIRVNISVTRFNSLALNSLASRKIYKKSLNDESLEMNK